MITNYGVALGTFFFFNYIFEYFSDFLLAAQAPVVYRVLSKTFTQLKVTTSRKKTHTHTHTILRTNINACIIHDEIDFKSSSLDVQHEQAGLFHVPQTIHDMTAPNNSIMNSKPRVSTLELFICSHVLNLHANICIYSLCLISLGD